MVSGSASLGCDLSFRLTIHRKAAVIVMPDGAEGRGQDLNLSYNGITRCARLFTHSANNTHTLPHLFGWGKGVVMINYENVDVDTTLPNIFKLVCICPIYPLYTII